MIHRRVLPDDIFERLTLLEDLFSSDDNVVFAYLFGSLAAGRRSVLSDVDIAVYLRSTNAFDYLDLQGRITETLRTDEVDLVILNSVPQP